MWPALLSERRSNHELLLPLVCLAILLLMAVPLFLRMPLTNDAELFDLQASAAQNGGVLYRDFLEPNLPGVIWLHQIARTLLGDSPEALRAFDLLIWMGILLVSGQLLRLAGGAPRTVTWMQFTLAACYLSQSEWCHCQRDGWMLLPAGCALLLRAQSLLANMRGNRVQLYCALSEGICWGLAVWLKPHVILPGTAVILISTLWSKNLRLFLSELLMIFCGGLVIGAAGVGWMYRTGCWPYYLETMRDWNPDYFAAGRDHWTWSRLVGIVWRLSPWSLLPIAALLQFATWFRDYWHASPDDKRASAPGAAVVTLVGSMFLAWSGQVVLLQHQFDYVYLPIVILAIVLLSVMHVAANQKISKSWPVGWMVFAILVLATSPLTDRSRLACWQECVRGPGTPDLQDRLALLGHPQQHHLTEIADYLRAQNISTHDVCCYNSDCVSLYRRLSLLPPVKYTYFFETLQFFPHRRTQILQEIAERPHQYVVTDLLSCGLSPTEALEVGPEGATAPPPAYRDAPRDLYPWNCPVVYRSGSYLVHRVMPLNNEEAVTARHP